MFRNIMRFAAVGTMVLAGGIAFRTTRANAAAASDVTTARIVALTSTSVLPTSVTATQDTVVFAGGCFWGVQGVFQHTKGVITARSGYSGGMAKTATYDQVSEGNTGHAESVRVIYDPSKVSFETLLTIFFSVVHDPTELNMQGPDHGTQYRSAVFTTTAEQKKATDAFVAKLTQEKVFRRPIVTQIVPLKGFYEAEAYHQDYATLHPTEMYIAINDLPKIANLKKQFPALWREELHQ